MERITPKRKRLVGVAVLCCVLLTFLLAGYFMLDTKDEDTQSDQSESITEVEDDSTTGASKESTNQETGEAQKQSSLTVQIPELNIQMDLPEGLEGLEYVMQDTGYTANSGEKVERFSPAFTTKELVAGDSWCTYGALGIILEVESEYPTSPGDPIVDIEGAKFVLNRPQSSCTADEALAELQYVQTQLLIDAFSEARNINEEGIS